MNATIRNPLKKENCIYTRYTEYISFIDAIPRITADANGNFTEIAFDLINAYDYEVQDLYDGADNAEGDSVEEGQYNTALSAIVENLM